MTDTETVPPSAQRILDRVERRIPDISRAAAIDPALRNLPVAIRAKEVPETSRRYFALTIRALRENQPMAEADLKGARERGTRRAEEGVPLSLVLHNWFYGAHVFLRACTEAADPDVTDGLSYIVLEYFRLHETMIRTVTDAYQTEQAVIASEERGGNHLVARLLMNGQDASAEAERFGIPLVEKYAVMALSLGTLPDEKTDDATGRAVAGRRKLRQVNRALGQHGSAPVLALLEPDGGELLLPDTGEDIYHDATEAVTRISALSRVPVTAALVESTAYASLPRSSDLAQELLRLVSAEQRPAGVYRLADVSLDYHLTRPTASTEPLLAVLAPLEPFPELLTTLETYYRHDLDRGPTARTLRVHPNTVNNRLNRIMDLLGMDPSKVESVLTLGTALKIRGVVPTRLTE